MPQSDSRGGGKLGPKGSCLIRYLDFSVAIRWEEESHWQRLQDVVLPIWEIEVLPDLPASVTCFQITKNRGVDIILGPNLGDVYHTDPWKSLERRLHLYFASNVTSRIFLHAGVVCWKDWSILLPGTSHSGKSTLVKSLVDCGFSYFSDEYAVIDNNGLVHPFPRRLSLRQGSTTQEISLWSGDTLPKKVSHVFLLQYVPTANHPWVELSYGQSMTAVLQQCVSASLRPEQNLKHLVQLLRHSPLIFSGDRGCAHGTASEIRRLVQLAEERLTADG